MSIVEPKSLTAFTLMLNLANMINESGVSDEEVVVILEKLLEVAKHDA